MPDPQAYPKLIVVTAYERGADGKLVTALGPLDMATEERALHEARILESLYAGVIAFTRDADPDLGQYGPPRLIHKAGATPSRI